MYRQDLEGLLNPDCRKCIFGQKQYHYFIFHIVSNKNINLNPHLNIQLLSKKQKIAKVYRNHSDKKSEAGLAGKLLIQLARMPK
jgi:hypothetical protein